MLKETKTKSTLDKDSELNQKLKKPKRKHTYRGMMDAKMGICIGFWETRIDGLKTATHEY